MLKDKTSILLFELMTVNKRRFFTIKSNAQCQLPTQHIKHIYVIKQLIGPSSFNSKGFHLLFFSLLSFQTCLRHPECSAARENRDTVFCQMRRAMDLIHYVVKDGVLDSAASLVTVPSSQSQPNRLSKEVKYSR